MTMLGVVAVVVLSGLFLFLELQGEPCRTCGRRDCGLHPLD